MNTPETTRHLPRSVRNNNPLNLRITREQRAGKNRWKGMRAEQTDPHFCQFTDPAWGWRAAFYQLRRYYTVHRLCTVRQIINRWAPPSDGNDTEAYISRVSQLMGYDPDKSLGTTTYNSGRWLALGAAMATVESGQATIDYLDMLEGWQLLMEEVHATA